MLGCLLMSASPRELDLDNDDEPSDVESDIISLTALRAAAAGGDEDAVVESMKLNWTNDSPRPPVCVSTTMAPIHALCDLVVQTSFDDDTYSSVDNTLEPHTNKPTTSSLSRPRREPRIVRRVPPSTEPSFGDTPVTCQSNTHSSHVTDQIM